MRQLSFLPRLKLDHGGALREGKRKIVRPFSHKHAIHVVLRSHRARGAWSLLQRHNERLVNETLKRCAIEHHIQVYNFVNVGNHLHLLIKPQSRTYNSAKRDFQAFLRRFAGEIAFQVMNAKKTEPKGRFWEKLVYTRLVNWGREYDRLKEYITKNLLESLGLWTGQIESFFLPTLESLRLAGVGPPRLRRLVTASSPQT